MKGIDLRRAGTIAYSFVAVATALIWGHYFNAWPCGRTDSASIDRVRLYLSGYYGLAGTDSLKIESVSPVRGSCMMRIQVSGPTLPRPATWFLSADHGYISAGIADLSRPAPLAQTLGVKDLQSLEGEGSPPALGAMNSSVVLVEFSDFECSYCGRLAYALREALEKMPSPRVRLVFRNYPLSIHAHARAAAELGACIARQSHSAFWRFHDRAFQDQGRLASPTFVRDSISLASAEFPSINVSALKRCVASRESAPDVERDIELGKGVAVSGTPTLFINGTRIVGARGSDSIRHLISLEEQRAAAAAFRFSP